MTRPNLFEFATKELSQDAFLCWLLKWASAENASEDQALHNAGRLLLQALLGKHQEEATDATVVEIRQQYARADIVVIVDNRLVLLLEDKVQAGEHGDQLRRYKAAVEAAFPHCRVLPTFIKTGDQSGYREIQAAGYALFLRPDLLQALRGGRARGVTNAIFLDFLDYLEQREEQINAFQTLPVSVWTQQWDPWTGFYQELGRHKPDLGWDYVSNRAGGFLGAWWHPRDWVGHSVYLQIEQGNLCFKIDVRDAADPTSSRDQWFTQLMDTAARIPGLSLQRPRRFGTGVTMTVAIVEQSGWLAEAEDGKLDWAATLRNLELAEHLVDEAVSFNQRQATCSTGASG
jgi:hypothetical protein